MAVTQTWIDRGITIGPQPHWWERTGMGWGEIGRATAGLAADAAPRRKSCVIEYWIEDSALDPSIGEWLSVVQITEDPRNERGLSLRAVDSRIRRLMRSGRVPKARGGSKHVRLGRATYNLDWKDIRRPPSPSSGVSARDSSGGGS